MELKKSKLIGDRKFYGVLLAIVLPIIAQNGITQFVGLLDNIMVGQTGTEAMSGVAIVNQIIFVFNLVLFGGLSGAAYLPRSITEVTIRKESAARCVSRS